MTTQNTIRACDRFLTGHFLRLNTKTDLNLRVPEDKCHMVLPEIEEEDENGQRLSLTSLLLGKILNILYLGTPVRYSIRL